MFWFIHSVATLALRPISKLTSGDCVQPVGPFAVVVKDVLGHLIVQSVQRSQVHLACLETVRSLLHCKQGGRTEVSCNFWR